MYTAWSWFSGRSAARCMAPALARILVPRLVLGLALGLALALMPRAALAQDCGCDIVVQPATTLIDGNVIPHAPGDVICLMAGTRSSLRIINFQGSASNYLVFKNCGGQVVVSNSTLGYGINVGSSKYFRLTGSGDSSFVYGIEVTLARQSGSMGITLGGYSTDYEVDHLDISETGFAGVMSKTEPGCNQPDLRHFVQRNTSFHDNYVHGTGGEGFYVGYSAYPSGTKPCGGETVTVYPHRLEGVAIYRNRVENTDWDGIQLGSTTAGGAIYENIVENFGLSSPPAHSNGMQLGAGTVADVYANWISSGAGNGMAVFGAGGNFIYNNVILDVGGSGIFCDDRHTTPGEGFHFINNTFVRPAINGMRMYSDESTGNVFYNNIIADPGQPCVYLLSSSIDWSESNTLCAATVEEVGFVAPASGNYHLDPDSPACEAGRDVSMYGVTDDYDGMPRTAPHDIGAFECASSGGGGGASEKLALAPSMVVQESGAGDARMLVDEQALAGDPRDGAAGQPGQAWISGTHSEMPASAYIDLGQEVDLTDIYLFDTNGNDTARSDEWVVSVGSPGNWTVVASEPSDSYLTWKRHPVSVRTRYVRVTNRVAYVRMAEVVLYGSAGTPPPPAENGKLALAPSMVVQESGDGDARMLIDEQTLAGDPRDGSAGQPGQAWITGTHSQMPANAYIDLGQEVDLTDIYLFDTNGNDTARSDEWVVSVGSPGSWTVVASEPCDGYQTWKRHTVSVRTRYVRLTNRVAYVRMAEVVLYGSAATP